MSMAAEAERSIESLVLEMKGVYVALPSLQPVQSDDWSAAPATASADDGAAAAELLAHAHALAHEIEALRRGPPQPLLRRDDVLLVLEALISSEILEGLEALERSTGAAPAKVYCAFVDTAHRIIYDAVAEDRLSAATRMASCLTGVDDVASYFRDMLRNTSRPVMRSRLLQILHAADRDGAAGAAHGYGNLLELRTLALEVQLTPPEESMRLLAPSVRLALALDHFYSVESFGVEFNSKSTALIMSQLAAQQNRADIDNDGTETSLSVAGSVGPRGWHVALTSSTSAAAATRHVLEDRTAELDDIGAVNWAAVAPNDMRSDIASGVSVSESHHPNAAAIDRHAPSDRSRQMFDPLSLNPADTGAQLRAYGHFRLLWLQEWSANTQYRVLAEVQRQLPQATEHSRPWLSALASGSSVEHQQRVQLQVLVDRHDVDGAVSLVRAVLAQAVDQPGNRDAAVEMVDDVVQGSGVESERYCAVLLREALANELASAGLFLPTERDPDLMVRRLARSGLLFDSPPESQLQPSLHPTDSSNKHFGDANAVPTSRNTSVASLAQATSCVLGFLAKHRAHAAISAFLRCRYPRCIPTEDIQACLDAVRTSSDDEVDPWVYFIVGSLSEEPELVFRACCENGQALLPELCKRSEDNENSGNDNSSVATVQAMLKAGQPLMALGTLLFTPITLEGITTQADSDNATSRLDLKLLNKALEDHGVDIDRFLTHLKLQSSPNNGSDNFLGSTSGLAKAASAAIARKCRPGDVNSGEPQQQAERSELSDFVQVFGAPASDLGFADELDSAYYLQHGRPAAAAEWHYRHYHCGAPSTVRQQGRNEVEHARSSGGTTGNFTLAAVAAARAVALQNCSRVGEDSSMPASSVVASCVQFCNILGLDKEARVLRADAAAINAIRSHLMHVHKKARSLDRDEDGAVERSSNTDASVNFGANAHRQSSMENACKTIGPQADIDIHLVLQCLEEVATTRAEQATDSANENLSSGLHAENTTCWDILRGFCEAHKDIVSMSSARARWLASSGKWIELLCEAQLSNLSIETMLEVVASHCKAGMREHFILFLRDQQARETKHGADSKSAAEAHSLHASDNAGHVYDQLCGTLLECTRRTDPSMAMLEAAVETSRPILALIGHSGFAAPTTKSMLAFVCARLSDSSASILCRNVFSIQPGATKHCTEEDVVGLLQEALCEAVRLHRAAVAAEAFVAFCPEHPLHSLFSFAHNCMQRRYQHAQTDLTDFINKSALGGNVAWTQSGLGAASTCKIARAIVTCMYQISTGVEKVRLAQVAGSAGSAGFSPQFYRRCLIVNLLSRMQKQPPKQGAIADDIYQDDSGSNFITGGIIDLLPKELVKVLTNKRLYTEACEFVTAWSLYAARQRLAFGFGIRSMLGQHQHPTSLWPRLRTARIDLVTAALQLATEASEFVAQHDIILAQAYQMVADFRNFGTDGTQMSDRRVEPSTVGTGLWGRCYDVLIEGAVPPHMIADFFLTEAERLREGKATTVSGAACNRAERVELLFWARTAVDGSVKCLNASKANTEEWKDAVMRRIFAVMDMDDDDYDDNSDHTCRHHFGSDSPNLVMVRRHMTTDGSVVAEALTEKIIAANCRYKDVSSTGGDVVDTVDKYDWDDWENDVLDLEEPTSVAEALVTQVERRPAAINASTSSAYSTTATSGAAEQNTVTMALAVERDTLLLALCCAVAGNEMQCIHRVLDVLQARCKVYARFGHVKILEQAAMLLAVSGCDEHSAAYVEPILEIYLYHDNDGHALLQSLTDTVAPTVEHEQTHSSAFDTPENDLGVVQMSTSDASLSIQGRCRRQHQQHALQAALLRSMKQRPQQFSSQITMLHRRLLPARRREFALFLHQRADVKVKELVRARRLLSTDAELQAEMSRTASTAQRLYGEAATLYAEDGCYRQQRRCSCLSSLLDMQQQNPDLELLELDKGPAAAAQALRSRGPLHGIGDVATYQLLATAHGFERQLDEAWPHLVYEHSILKGSLEFFTEFLHRVSATTVFYEQLARHHYLAVNTERRSTDETTFIQFAARLKQAGLLEAHSKMLAAIDDTQRLLQL